MINFALQNWENFCFNLFQNNFRIDEPPICLGPIVIYVMSLSNFGSKCHYSKLRVRLNE